MTVFLWHVLAGVVCGIVSGTAVAIYDRPMTFGSIVRSALPIVMGLIILRTLLPEKDLTPWYEFSFLISWAISFWIGAQLGDGIRARRQRLT